MRINTIRSLNTTPILMIIMIISLLFMGPVFAGKAQKSNQLTEIKMIQVAKGQYYLAPAQTNNSERC